MSGSGYRLIVIENDITTTTVFIVGLGFGVYNFYHVVDSSCVDSTRNPMSPYRYRVCS